MPPQLHLGKYFRYIWEEKDLLIVVGNFPEVALSRRLYDERHQIAPLEHDATMQLTQLMGAAALAAVSLADRESWGWTLTTVGSDLGFFVGVEPEGMICGRVSPSEPEKIGAYVQRQKGKAPVTQSFFEPDAPDPFAAVAQYFEQSVQTQTRIVLEEDASGILVQGLPGGDFGAVRQFSNGALMDEIHRMADEKLLKPVGEVLIFYECRCDDEMVLNMITSLPESERRAVWGDERSLSIECPRCGRGYEINRPLH